MTDGTSPHAAKPRVERYSALRQITNEPYSPKGPESVKITTLYRCRVFRQPDPGQMSENVCSIISSKLVLKTMTNE